MYSRLTFFAFFWFWCWFHFRPPMYCGYTMYTIRGWSEVKTVLQIVASTRVYTGSQLYWKTTLMHKLAKYEQQSWKTFHPLRGMYSPTSSVLIKLHNGINSFNHKLLSSLQSPSRLDDRCHQGSHKYGHWDLQARSCWSALQRL